MINFKDIRGNSIISLSEIKCIYDTPPIIWGCELNVANSFLSLKTEIAFEILELQTFNEKLIKLNQGKKKIVDFISSDNKFQLKLIQSHMLELHATIDMQISESLTRVELSFITDQTIIEDVITCIAQL